MGKLWLTAKCPICGKDYQYLPDYIPATCGQFVCLQSWFADAMKRRQHMHTNPHEKTIVDEASGIEVTNQRYEDWEDGYKECWNDLVNYGGTFLTILTAIKEIGEEIYGKRN